MDEKELLAFRTAFGFGGKKKWGGLVWEEKPEQQIGKLLGSDTVATLRQDLSRALADAPDPGTLPSATIEDLEDPAWGEVINGMGQTLGVLVQNPAFRPPQVPIGNQAQDEEQMAAYQVALTAFNKRMEALASLPGTEMTKEEGYLLRAVIGMRFTVNLQGAFDNEALRRLYKLLLSLPMEHYANNTKLGAIKRTVPAAGDTADPPAYQNHGGIITLPVANPARKFSVTLDGEPVGEPISYFDHATLHEIGHSVDGHKTFMEKRGAQKSYGGWAPADVTDIATAGRDRFGLIAACQHRTQGELRDILVQGLGGQVDENAYPAAEDEPLRAALRWCAAVRLNGDNGAWRLKGSALQNLAIEKRLFQESYPGIWCSYDIEARADAISSYQFRADGEWFAEVYAAYYSGLVPRNDPRFAWLQGLVDSPWT